MPDAFYLVAEDLRARRLVCVLEEFEPAGRGVYVIYPPTRLLPSRTRELLKYLVPELERGLREVAREER